MTTAAARAAHLVVDREPWLFEDTLAAALLGDEADDLLAAHRERPTPTSSPRCASP
jgi:hypothetical protein